MLSTGKWQNAGFCLLCNFQCMRGNLNYHALFEELYFFKKKYQENFIVSLFITVEFDNIRMVYAFVHTDLSFDVLPLFSISFL